MLFARQTQPGKETIHINKVVHQALSLLESRLSREGVILNLQLEENIPETVLDGAQFVQVIVNLVVNAVQAMPEGGKLTIRTTLKENMLETEVIMITGYPSIEGAVTAVKIGAEEYLTKPFTDEELLHTVNIALKKQKNRKLASGSKKAAVSRFKGLVGNSPAMLKLFQQIEKAARTDATVLISGESGTGKELVARAIHYVGKRAAAPFVPVNCSGIPEGLLESSLFGYVKGAFTGAVETRAGFFQWSVPPGCIKWT